MIRFAHPSGPSFGRSPRFALRPACAGMTMRHAQALSASCADPTPKKNRVAGMLSNALSPEPCMTEFARLIRAVPNFPKPGITFRDITPLLADGPAFARCIDALVEPLL